MEQAEEDVVAFEATFVRGLRVAAKRLAEQVRTRHQAELLRRSLPRIGTAIIITMGLPPGTEAGLVALVVAVLV